MTFNQIYFASLTDKELQEIASDQGHLHSYRISAMYELNQRTKEERKAKKEELNKKLDETNSGFGIFGLNDSSMDFLKKW